MDCQPGSSPLSNVTASTPSANSTTETDTPLSDTTADETKTLPNDAPRRQLSYLDNTDNDSTILSILKGPDWPEIIPSIWEDFVQSAIKYPDALAVASIAQKGELLGLKNLPLDHELYQANPYVRWSYAEFTKGVTRLLGALQEHGVKEGYPVFTFVNNCAEFPLIFWAAATLGCSIIPIHPRTLLNTEEATHILTTAISSSPASSAIVFAQNGQLAKQILDLNVLYKTTVVVIDDNETSGDFHKLHNFILAGKPGNASTLLQYRESASKWATIIFTSGTTALPKGVVQTAYRLDRWIQNRRHAVPVVQGDSCFLTLPTNHIFYPMTALVFWSCGGATVLPSPSFAPLDAPEIFVIEKCTHLPSAPTMVYALAQVAKEKNFKLSSLKNMTVGGSKLSEEIVKNCLLDIGSPVIEIIYGCTEAGIMGTTSDASTVQDLLRGGDITVGHPPMGATVKVCAPGGKEPLPRAEEGELHVSSQTLTNGYVGDEAPESFYTDGQGERWFATGDAAMINNEGLIFIVGRVKDMMIRGGVNISPAAIEFVLANEPETERFGVQIVGRQDIIAGEIPIAISSKHVTLMDIDKIQDTVLHHMGPVFLPEEVLTLEQLGLTDFPKTMLGKPQKAKLRDVVRQYLEKRDKSTMSDDHEADETTSVVQKIWTRTIGHAVEVDAQISDFADSITIMRVRDRFLKELGVNVGLSDMLSTKTLGAQIEMIRQQKQSKADRASSSIVSKPTSIDHDGTLTNHDIIHLASNSHWFSTTQAHINDEIGKVGLSWEDVQTITPAADFTQILTQADILNTSWSWKFSFLAKPGIDKKALRHGIEVMLANNPMMASFLLWNRKLFGSDIALHVLFKHNQKLFNGILHDHGSIATKEEFVNLVFNPYEYEMSLLPGLLVQFLLFDITETGQSGTVMVAHHVPFDASYMQLIFDDLDKALGEATRLDPHVPYKTWADSYYSLRTSPEARTAVNWHLDRLNDLVSLRSSVFPPLPRPHHYLTQSQHIQEVSDNGYHTDFHARGITNLRRQHSALSAPTIIKAAWSLLNIYRTNTSVALFSNLQADRRRFPFIPSGLIDLAPPETFSATDVAGPTLQDVVNVIPLHPSEIVLEFMNRVSADQEELNTHAAAPLKTILQDLGPINSEVMLDILRSQIFNWTPGLGAMQIQNPNENYEPNRT